MSVDISFLIEGVLDMKTERSVGSKLQAFLRENPGILEDEYIITDEIRELDAKRKEVFENIEELQELAGGDPEESPYFEELQEAEESGYYLYRDEMAAFYEANKEKLDPIIAKYQQLEAAEEPVSRFWGEEEEEVMT
jgi:hypothetical protein